MKKRHARLKLENAMGSVIKMHYLLKRCQFEKCPMLKIKFLLGYQKSVFGLLIMYISNYLEVLGFSGGTGKHVNSVFYNEQKTRTQPPFLIDIFCFLFYLISI